MKTLKDIEQAATKEGIAYYENDLHDAAREWVEKLETEHKKDLKTFAEEDLEFDAGMIYAFKHFFNLEDD